MAGGLLDRCLRAPFPGRRFAGRTWHYVREARAARDARDARFRPNAEGRLDCQQLFGQKSGLEIGGPSGIFLSGGLFPVYPVVGQLDNCNFSDQTVWSGTTPEGTHFRYDENHAPGQQFIHEATSLAGIASKSYDFVLASHCIEHVANPLRALREWRRVLKVYGILVLVVPHPDRTFDHRRPTTTLSHLIADDKAGVGEGDLTHLPEILALHDLEMDVPAGDIEHFRRRSEKNLENRCLHHHVFDTTLAIQMMDYAGLQIHAVWQELPHHIFVVGEKLRKFRLPKNSPFLKPRSLLPFESPFPRDRLHHAGATRPCGS
jgi:SAM-dependent methyltransferase